MKQKIIALDCDGVLLNYNAAYGKVWLNHYGKEIPVVNPNAYHAENYFDIKWPSPEERTKFFHQFNLTGWGLMDALPNAIEATHILRDAGYKIVVVTSMNQKAQDMRFKNLQELGFAFDEVIATGKKINNINPKKSHIELLSPEYFVDDLIDNFHDIQSKTHLVLIDTASEDSPNLTFKGDVQLHSKHTTLLDFVQNHIVKINNQ